MGTDYLFLNKSPNKEKIPVTKILSILVSLLLVLVVIPSSFSSNSNESSVGLHLDETVSYRNNVFIKRVKIDPNMIIENDNKVRTSIPEVRYDFQVDVLSVTKNKKVDDFIVSDSDDNGLFDTVEWDVDSVVDEVFETRVDFNKVQYKDEVSDYIENDDGTYTAVFSGARNYYNKSLGKYQPIDVNVKLSERSFFKVENRENTIESFFGDDGVNQFIVDGVTVSFDLSNAGLGNQKKNTIMSYKKNQVKYQDLYDNVDVRFTVLSGEVLEEFVVKKSISISEISEVMSFDVPLYYLMEDDGSISFYKNGSQQVLFSIPRPVMWEDGNVSERCYGLYFVVERIDENSLVIKKVIDEEGFRWLGDGGRKYPVVIDDTLTRYSNTDDGYVSNSGSDWPTVRNAASGNYVASNTNYYNNAHRAYLQATTYYVTRSFFYFDTSSLLDDCTIISATFSLYGYQYSSANVTVQEGTQGTGALTVEDYDAFTGSSFASVDSWSTSGYNDFTLNSAGLSAINKTGNTFYCTREKNKDYSGGYPGGGTMGSGCYYADNSGNTKDPKLEVTYTTAAPNSYIDNIPDPTNISNVESITGNASDPDTNLTGVYLDIKNNTDGTYWCNGWKASCIEQINQCDLSLSASATDGSFDEDEEDWYYTPTFNWADGKNYTITVAARDDGVCDSTPANDTFTIAVDLNTSVDTITPYTVATSPLNITATNSGETPDYITLYYRYSSNNVTWGGYSEGNTDWYSPSDTGETYNDWSNPTNAFSSNNQYADEDTSSEAQDYFAFGISLPEIEIILGINISIEAYADGGDGVIGVELSWDRGGHWTSTDFKNTWTNGAGESIQYYGGSEETWGNEWDADQLSDGNFRVRCIAELPDKAGAIYVDHIQVMVYYLEIISGWMEWQNTSNPDEGSPYYWNFNFPNSTGYYQFYSIGQKDGNTEDAPASADAICYYSNINISFSVIPETWNQGTKTIGTTNETENFYFNLTNDGNTAIDVQIKATNATNSTTGAEWILNASVDYNKYALQFNRSDTGTWTTINTSYDTFKENILVSGYQTFDLKIFFATSSSKHDPLEITVTFKSVAH